VFLEYGQAFYGLARRMLNNDADAEDVTSEVLRQVVRKLDTFRGESSLGTWLYKITANAGPGPPPQTLRRPGTPARPTRRANSYPTCRAPPRRPGPAVPPRNRSRAVRCGS